MTSADTDARERLGQADAADTNALGAEELRARIGRLEARIAALTSSDAQHHSVLASIQDGYVEIGLRGQFLTANDSFCRITGYSLEELVTMNFQAVVDADTATRLKQTFAAVMATREPIDHLEWQFTRANGERRTVEGSVQLILGENDQPVGFRGIGRDITERKQRERRLAESEEKYRTILETLQDGYYELDEHGRFVFFNDALLRISGYSRAELCALDFRDAVDDETAKRLVDLFRSAARTKKPVQGADWDFIRGDGLLRTVSASIAPQYDAANKLRGFRGTVRDTTDAKRLIRLEALNEFAASVANALPTAILALEADGTVVATNAAWLEAEPVNGLGVEQCDVGDNYLSACAESSALTKETRETIVRGVRRVMRDQQGQFDLEYQIIAPDGGRWFVVRVRPVQAKISTRAVVTHIDVTDRVRALEAVRESEVRLNRAQEAGAIGTWEFDCASGEIFWSDGTYRLYGLEPESVTPMQALRMTVAPETFKDRAAQIEAAISSPGPTDFAYPITWPDGSQHVLHHYGRTICDAAGKAVTMVGTVQDVTDRERTAAALRASEESLERAQAVAQIGSWDWNVASGAVRWSAETFRLLQVDPDKIDPTFETFVARIHPEDRDAVRASLDAALAGQAHHDATFRAVLPDGTTRRIQAIGQVVVDDEGKPTRMVGTIQDVTERLEAEESFRSSEERLARAQAVAHIGSWEVDLNTDKQTWSDETFRLLGLQPGTAEATHELVLARIHPDDREAAHAGYQSAIAGGPPYDMDYRIRHADGQERMIHVYGEVVEGEGVSSRLVATLQDVTEQRRAAHALQTSEAMLARAQRVARIGSWEHGVESGKQTWSDETYRIWGFEPGSVQTLHETTFARIHPDDRKRAQAAFEAALAGGPAYDVDYRAIIPGQGEQVLHVHGELIQEKGLPERLVATVQNVTLQRRVEEEVRTYEDRLRALVANAPVVLLTTDAQGEITLVDGSALADVGMETGELVGKPVSSLNAPELDDAIRRGLQGKAFRRRFSAAACASKGTSHHCSTRTARSPARPALPSTCMRNSNWRTNCGRRKKWKPWGGWPAASPMTSTTCCR